MKNKAAKMQISGQKQQIKSRAFKNKTQAKTVAKMQATQDKVAMMNAKANLMQAKQMRMKERNKTTRTAAVATSVTSPWNNIINNNDNTGLYQTGTVGETPDKDGNTSNDWSIRG